LSVVIRDAQVTDRAFISQTWVTSFRSSQDTGPVPVEIYFDTFRKVIADLLARPAVKVLVAVDSELPPPHEIHGYLVFEPGPHRKGTQMLPKSAVHFCYVKELHRRQGVARSLFREAGIDPAHPFFFTFRTPDARAVLKERRWQGEYHPNIVKYTKQSKEMTA